MAQYKLLPDEVVLFKDDCVAHSLDIDGNILDKNCLLTLTNIHVILTRNEIFDNKNIYQSLCYKVADIKIYNQLPQVKVDRIDKSKVEIYFTHGELELTFIHKKMIKEFINQVDILLTGKSNYDEKLNVLQSSLQNVKKTIAVIDQTLEVDSVKLVQQAVSGIQNFAKNIPTKKNIKKGIAGGVQKLLGGAKQTPTQTDNEDSE